MVDFEELRQIITETVNTAEKSYDHNIYESMKNYHYSIENIVNYASLLLLMKISKQLDELSKK